MQREYDIKKKKRKKGKYDIAEYDSVISWITKAKESKDGISSKNMRL